MSVGKPVSARFPWVHLLAAGLVAAVCLTALVLVPQQAAGPASAVVSVPEPVRPAPLPEPAPESPLPVEPQVRHAGHEIRQGDTLSGIFAEHGFDAATLNAVLAADEELLALDVLRPGNRLQFERAEDGSQLLVLSLTPHPGRTIHYRRAADGFFEFEEVIQPTHWREEVVSTTIHGSFYASAAEAGVSDTDIVQVQRILRERVDFRRDIRAGDWFEIVLGRQVAGAEATGQSRIEAIRLHLEQRRTHSAFLHDDGNYYNERGESLGHAFLRYPMQGKYRVSSPYNLRRLHPVTKRIAPHHGVDFAMPTGTPILSTGDGVVTRIGDHPYAGKYLEISHAGQFKTRYLHLSRIQVRQGQQVRRGQRVALSGNTGRSTGPHLHFELHVHGRPVDPLTADIPTASSVPPEELMAFTQRVSTLVARMQNETLLASRSDTSVQRTDI